MTPDPAAASGTPSSGVPAGVRALAEELVDAIRAWEERPAAWSDERFGRMALRAFRLQLRHNEPYRRYCDARDATPDRVEGWREIPPVPTAAFREVELAAGDPAAAPLRFRTSGTTRGRASRGAHPVLLPEVYRASAETAFRRFVLDGSGFPERARPREGAAGGGPARRPVLSLIPPYPESDASSLAWMVDAVRERFGGEGSVHAAGADGIDREAAAGWARQVAADGRPACVLGTTLGLDDWTRWLASEGRSFPLPPGSRVMDTGGSKGREGLRREDVLDRLEARLAVPREAVINEFGMTELLSQRYASPRDGLLHGPPWLRTRALDPVTLEPLEEGEEGVLCHVDLANVAGVSAVLTEDLGSVRNGAVAWRGRTAGAVPRGCSLATAELLAAQPDTQDA